MIHAVDHVVIAVGDLEEATDSYTRILGRTPSWRGEHAAWGTSNTLFRLANTYLELLAPTGPGPLADGLRDRIAAEGEGPYAIAFGVDDADDCAKQLRERGIEASDPVEGSGCEETSGTERRWRNVLLPQEDTRGVALFCIEHLSPRDALPVAEPTSDEAASVMGLDHLVVQSKDGDATRALYGDALGLRLALDRSNEKWGSRLLFFRVGGVTVEVSARLGADPEPDAPDHLWGLAYQVPDIERAVARMVAANVDVSEVRTGRKDGTHVATIKAPTHGVATLLVQPTWA
jgi:catechol 2,3-dioxygenase-like lactoylglutathione lyase family enzyme